MLIALVLFAIGGSVGVYMVLQVFKKREVPKSAIIAHGIANSLGLILVIAGVIEDNKSSTLMTSLIFFLLAVGGGVILFYFDKVKGGTPPKILVVGHPLIALAGVALLIIYLGLSLK